MWYELNDNKKLIYKKLILGFSSLTEMFTQKKEDEDIPAPILVSKYHETAFQRAFGAQIEDIGNTSYDASLRVQDENGKETKYLIGLKTFGFHSGDQKIAQFKADSIQWTQLFEQMRQNAQRCNTIDEINQANQSLYYEVALHIAKLRNLRIQSSIENLRGFQVGQNDEIQSLYHVLMPSKKNERPQIHVGEISYDPIDIDNLEIQGCTKKTSPTNFKFTDGNHEYKYTSADSQLLMNFHNQDIVLETWDVKYLADAFQYFIDISDKTYGFASTPIISPEISPITPAVPTESYSWSLLNKDGEVELFSAWNGFYGVGTKIGTEERKSRIQRLLDAHQSVIPSSIRPFLQLSLQAFLLEPAKNKEERLEKVELRNTIMKQVRELDDETLLKDVTNLLYRPMDELYIPLPNSKQFHLEHPNFFIPGYRFKVDEKTGKITGKTDMTQEERTFNLVFEPSGNSIPCYIAQDWGKAIESTKSQAILGDWLLRKVFQLEPYEPLTANQLEKVGINGYRLWKKEDEKNIHLEFIWLDEDELPNDYINKKRSSQ